MEEEYQTSKPLGKLNRSNTVLVIISTLLVLIIVSSPYTNMFGQYYKPTNDYTCCKNGQLYTYHYFADYVFWTKIRVGYKKEKVGNPSAGGCNIECPPIN